MTSSTNLFANWDSVKEKIKESNVHITDEDLSFSPGGEEKMLSRLADKLKKTPEAVKDWIESIAVNKNMAG